MEELIWNTILNSAKKRFDYQSFEEPLLEYGDDLPENILFKIITEFAMKTELKIISAKIYSDILLSGLYTDKKELDDFIAELSGKLKLEVYITQLASEMLQNGTDEIAVLNTVNQLL